MIEVRNLTKKYGDIIAVDNISFTIEPGKIYGLLGPNGAGKSTTMNIITGCLAATDGVVKVCGHDIFEEPIMAKRHIGYLPEIPPLYPEMTPIEYLVFVAEAKGVEYEAVYRQVREVIELTQLEDVKDRLIKNLSKGYRQRVGIAQAMLGNPDIIIFDEPTVGLDPKQIIEIRDLIRQLGEIKTVILSSHILAEISEVCERVIIISHGKIVADDTLQNLKGAAGSSEALIISVRGERDTVTSVLSSIEGIIEFEEQPAPEGGDVSRFRIAVEKGADLRDSIFFAMADRRCAVIAMETQKSSLESIFLSLTEDTAGLPDSNDTADTDSDENHVDDNDDDSINNSNDNGDDTDVDSNDDTNNDSAEGGAKGE